MDRTRIELIPLTGRSHQLRVHMQQLGHPILGDKLYASPEALNMAERLMLHACAADDFASDKWPAARIGGQMPVLSDTQLPTMNRFAFTCERDWHVLALEELFAYSRACSGTPAQGTAS